MHGKIKQETKNSVCGRWRCEWNERVDDDDDHTEIFVRNNFSNVNTERKI
jgi:hypothetical protein